jgi:hypothetical protein
MATKKELLKLRRLMRNKKGQPKNIIEFMRNWQEMMEYLDVLIKEAK